MTTGKFHSAQVAAHFFPSEKCGAIIASLIGTAKKSVELMAYTFTDPQIPAALEAAVKRGVTVRAVFDNYQNQSNALLPPMVAAGVSVMYDPHHLIAHNKIVIVDDTHVVTGSHNFTKTADMSNAENIVIISSAALAADFVANFELHWAHAQAAPKVTPTPKTPAETLAEYNEGMQP